MTSFTLYLLQKPNESLLFSSLGLIRKCHLVSPGRAGLEISVSICNAHIELTTFRGLYGSDAPIFLSFVGLKDDLD